MSDIILPNNPKFATLGHLPTNNQPLPPVDLTQVMAQVAADVFEQMLTAKVKVKFKKLTSTAKTPTYATSADTCVDLYADEEVDIPPHTVGKISTGLAFEAPPGVYFRIMPRSGMSSKGIIVTSGVVDNAYRGDIIVALHNSTSEPYHVSTGDKIAQVEPRTFHQMELEEVNELSNTDRGQRGFGSSGK
nr:MAG TPA: dUTPase [Caudoviricetes sp.]